MNTSVLIIIYIIGSFLCAAWYSELAVFALVLAPFWPVMLVLELVAEYVPMVKRYVNREHDELLKERDEEIKRLFVMVETANEARQQTELAITKLRTDIASVKRNESELALAAEMAASALRNGLISSGRLPDDPEFLDSVNAAVTGETISIDTGKYGSY